MKHVRPIVSRELLEPLLDVLAQLGPVVLGELLGARWGPFGFHTVDAEGGIEPIDKRCEELELQTAEAHPFVIGVSVDAIKGCAAVEAVASAWCGEVGAVVGVEEGEGDVKAAASEAPKKIQGETRLLARTWKHLRS